MPENRPFALTNDELDKIVELIQPIFVEHVARYDERKYPPSEYECLLSAFREPAKIRESDIRRALMWKFGYYGRDYDRIPRAHRELISFVHGRWRTETPAVGSVDSSFSSILAGSGGVFDRLIAASYGRRYITFAFLKHLIRPDEIPIIDQHNYRAMNHYVQAIRPAWRTASKPGKHDDLLALSIFLRAIKSRWEKVEPLTAPTERDLDRFLMMYGKSLKLRKKRRPRSNAEGRLDSR